MKSQTSQNFQEHVKDLHAMLFRLEEKDHPNST
jgi:hypothetical protein